MPAFHVLPGIFRIAWHRSRPWKPCTRHIPLAFNSFAVRIMISCSVSLQSNRSRCKSESEAERAYYNNRRYQHRLFIQTPMQAHVSAMNRAAWYRFAQKIRRLLVETANINLILFFCLLDGVHLTTQSLVFRGLTINTNPTVHYSGLTCSSCSQ